MKFSLIEINISLTVATGFAQLLGTSHPEHAKAVHQFCEKVNRSRKELRASIENIKQAEQEGHDGSETDAP